MLVNSWGPPGMFPSNMFIWKLMPSKPVTLFKAAGKDPVKSFPPTSLPRYKVAKRGNLAIASGMALCNLLPAR
eukprot:5660350-Amphidinium_carterae.1